MLRYAGTLDTMLREWTICVVARELSSRFEWDMHLPLAEAVGVPPAALAAGERDAPSRRICAEISRLRVPLPRNSSARIA